MAERPCMYSIYKNEKKKEKNIPAVVGRYLLCNVWFWLFASMYLYICIDFIELRYLFKYVLGTVYICITFFISYNI